MGNGSSTPDRKTPGKSEKFPARNTASMKSPESIVSLWYCPTWARLKTSHGDKKKKTYRDTVAIVVRKMFSDIAARKRSVPGTPAISWKQYSGPKIFRIFRCLSARSTASVFHRFSVLSGSRNHRPG